MPASGDGLFEAQRIVRISRVVSDLNRAEDFYGAALGFRGVSRTAVDGAVLRALGADCTTASEALMRLGSEEIALVQFAAPGRPYIVNSRSDDLWFQHLAIVVSDMDAAYVHLSSNGAWQPISVGGPQTLPASSGAVRAFKFRDPDGHPLELLWLPPGRGRSVWQALRRSADAGLFLGIDHSALSVASTRRSLAFYGSLGMRRVEQSANRGPAQSRLDGLQDARVRVTGLRPASPAGPGLELLAYRPPGRAIGPAFVTDLSTDWVTVAALPTRVRDAAAVIAPRVIADPDGHRLVFVDQGVGSAGPPASGPLT
jgi:catechol 2,3-dioxygenase-like lactoylglutathione lyase family enzyme